MKKQLSPLTLLIITLLFSACSHVEISERAIVKAIIVERADAKYTVSLVIFDCEPTSQISEVKDDANVYTAQGESLSIALSNVEKKQNKLPFYAQNELLIINENAIGEFNETVKFFTGEEASRPGMSIYLTSKTAKDFKKSKDFIPKIIKACENTEYNGIYIKNKKLFDIQKQNDEYSAILPVLTFGEKSNEFYGIEELAAINGGVTEFTFKGDDAALTLLLEGATNKLNMTDIGEDKITFEANEINISYEVKSDLSLTVYLNGNIRALKVGSMPLLEKSKVEKYESAINEMLNEKCYDIIKNFLLMKNDAFKYRWHIEMKNKMKYDKLMSDNSFFEKCKISFVSDLIVL